MGIKDFLKQSIDRGASDLHLGQGQKPMLRIDGDMIAISDSILDAKSMQGFLSEVATADQKKQFDADLELDFSYELKGVARFRVNVFKQMLGLSMVYRTIPMDIWSLDELGTPPIFK